MSEADHTRYVRLLEAAETDTQRAILERGLGASRNLAELEGLASSMRGVPDRELIARHTGEGLFQTYRYSCVPASHQIALAEVDPIYAQQAHARPAELAAELARRLRTTGGRVDPAPNSGAMTDAISRSPELRSQIQRDSALPSGTQEGVYMCAMDGTWPQRRLELRAGADYRTVQARNSPGTVARTSIRERLQNGR